MSPNALTWWSDEKVDATVTSQFVHSHLRPDEAEHLTSSVFGDLSDDTYLEWIVSRAKRFFLILIDAGVPNKIFAVIDDSFEDEDLPISEDSVSDLRLSQHPNKSLDRRFYRAQFKYLTRVVGDGEHIRYADEESIPLYIHGLKPKINKDGADKVSLPNRPLQPFIRRRFSMNSRVSEEIILGEIAASKILCHQHVLSIYGSYTHVGNLFVLLTPYSEYSLKGFLGDLPKAFEALPKDERRIKLLQWPYCLANALAWLHARDKHHGCIRPSRIHIDDEFNICLGFFDGDWVLGMITTKDDIEAYQYAAPERWKRAVTVQSTTGHGLMLPSGGRTHRKKVSTDGSSGELDDRSSLRSQSLSTISPTSTSYAFVPTSKSTFSRLKLGTMKSLHTNTSANHYRSESHQTARTEESQDTVRPIPSHYRQLGPASFVSSISPGSRTRGSGPYAQPIFASAPEIRTAVVQTWKSTAHDLPAADIFSTAAVIMDILTVICKRSVGSFTKHRASRNRQAGRGGGLADASFHANLGQVTLWAQMLHKDAEKKIKKKDGYVFNAVGPILQVVMQCLDRDPAVRMNAENLSRKLEEHLSDFASIKHTHCQLRLPHDSHDSPISGSEKNVAGARTNVQESFEARSHVSHDLENDSNYSHAEASGTRLPTIEDESQTSDSSTESFHYGTEALSDTAVEVDLNQNAMSKERWKGKELIAQRPRQLSIHKKNDRWSEDQKINRAEIDSSSVVSSSSTPRTYVHTSISSSVLSATNGSHGSFTTFSSPATLPPNRKLPSPPSNISRIKPKQMPKNKTNQHDSSLMSVVEATHKLSRAVGSPPMVHDEVRHKNFSHPNGRGE